MEDNKKAVLSLFAERLRHWRKIRELSQKALAEKAGVSETTLAAYELGRKAAGIDKLIALTRVLGCSVADLLGDGVNTVRDWRIARCVAIAEEMGFNVVRDEAGRHDLVWLCGTKKLSDDLSPLIVTEDVFLTLFEQIVHEAISRADLTKIAVEVLNKV